MKRWSWLLAIALSVSTLAIVGCSGDDEETTPTTTTTVVTNIVGGVHHTNVVVVTNTPAPTGGTTPPPAGSANANVAGNWNGGTTFSGNYGHFDVSLTQDAADVIRGTFSNEFGASGKVGGTSAGDHIVLTFQYTGGAPVGYTETWDGHVNAAVDDFIGTVTPNNGNAAGTFGLQK